MKVGLRYARLSAAIIAALCGATTALADNYIYDPQLTGTTTGSDINPGGTSNWDTTTAEWVDQTTPSGDVVWPNTITNSAIIGTTASGDVANTTSDTIQLTTNINVQNITLQASDVGGTYYNYDIADDGNGENLTLGGNFIKATGVGQSTIQLSGSFILSGGSTHVFAINDTPGAVPELSFYSPIVGTDSLTLNNAYNNSGYTEYGTLVLDVDNPNFSGGINVVDGALTANTSAALGTGTTSISSMGALEFGGNGTKQASSTLTITNPISISRSVYTGTNYSDYTDAVISTNSGVAGSVLNFNGPVVIDSTDARIAANTSTINFNTAFTIGPDVAAGSTPMADLDGDFAGFANLNADNTAYGAAGGAIGIMGGVEVNASTIGELGGQGSTLVLNGGFLHITSALVSSDPNIVNNFGAGTSHNINTSAVSTGVDLDSGITFTVNNLSGAGVGERGLGTLDFTGTNNFSSGNPFFDGGTINYEASSSTSQGSIGVRSATININGALTLGSNTDSIGDSSTGTNGGPDKAIINISTTGSMVETGGGNFDVSNSANTQGTINMSGNAVLTTAGITWLGQSSGAVGTINQNGGALTINRSGNFGFVIGDGRGDSAGVTGPTGSYNLNGGTFSSPNGEIYVGEGDGNGSPGIGNWTQTSGQATFGTYFVVGRKGATGTLNVSGGTLSQSGTNTGVYFSIGEGINVSGAESTNVSTVTVSGTGQLTEGYGQFFVGNGNNSSGSNNSGTGILNIGTAAGATTGADATASVTVNNWLAVGRAGTSNGTVNLYDGTLTQAVSNYFDISGDGGSPTGTVNVYGGTLNAYQMLIGENGSGTGTLNIDGGNVNLPNNTVLANSGTVSGTINLNGGTLTAYGFQANNGLLSESAGTGKATFDFNGGTLVASTNNTTAFIGAKVTSIVSAGGANINTNGYSVTINSALKHDSTLSGADGGLTVSGGGTLTLGGTNTYTGLTTQSSGTLVLNPTAQTPVFSNGGENLESGSTVFNYSGTTYPVATTVVGDLTASYNAPGGPFTSGQIFSSTAIAGKTGLGYADNTTTSQVTVMYTLYGDANLDGSVSIADFNALAANFGLASGATWAEGDFNYDGSVSIADFNLLAANFGDSLVNGVLVSGTDVDYAPLLAFAEAHNDVAGFEAAINSVPEPTTLGIMVVGALAMSARRRRSSGK